MLKTLLLLLLLLAGFMSFIPHIGYAYPLHVDEWMHLTYARTIARTGEEGDFPYSEKARDEMPSLPIYPGMTTGDDKC